MTLSLCIIQFKIVKYDMCTSKNVYILVWLYLYDFAMSYHN